MKRITKVKKILKDHMYTRLHFLFKKNQYIILSISVVYSSHAPYSQSLINTNHHGFYNQWKNLPYWKISMEFSLKPTNVLQNWTS